MGVRGDPGGLQQVPVAGWRAAVRVPVPLTGGRRSRYVYRVGISSGVATRLPFPEGRPYAAAW
jgi:hypothetical protein